MNNNTYSKCQLSCYHDITAGKKTLQYCTWVSFYPRSVCPSNAFVVHYVMVYQLIYERHLLPPVDIAHILEYQIQMWIRWKKAIIVRHGIRRSLCFTSILSPNRNHAHIKNVHKVLRITRQPPCFIYERIYVGKSIDNHYNQYHNDLVRDTSWLPLLLNVNVCDIFPTNACIIIVMHWTYQVLLGWTFSFNQLASEVTCHCNL